MFNKKIVKNLNSLVLYIVLIYFLVLVPGDISNP